MRKQYLLPALALAVAGLVATAGAAAKEPARTQAGAAKKAKPKAKPAQRPKSTRKTAPKPVAKPSLPTAAPSTDTRHAITKAGDYRFAVQHDGRERTYRLHVPAGYAASQAVPLVVALHGAADDAQAGDGLQGLLRESDRQGFVVVFPDAYRASAKGPPASWNAGHCCGEARQQQVDDVGFIETVVTNVFRQLSIERYRIYAVGMSDGGMMAYRLACDRPNIFKAVASVGGTDNTAACTPGKPVSVLHIHARNDPRVPFSTAADSAARGATSHFTSARDTAAKWAELNGCMTTPQPILQQAGASCEAWSYCRGRAEVRLCATDTGGHSWPGAARRRGAEAPSQALSATRVTWSFFNTH